MTDVEKAAMTGSERAEAVSLGSSVDALVGSGQTVWDVRRVGFEASGEAVLSHSDHLDHNDGHVDAHGDHGDK